MTMIQSASVARWPEPGPQFTGHFQQLLATLNDHRAAEGRASGKADPTAGANTQMNRDAWPALQKVAGRLRSCSDSTPQEGCPELALLICIHYASRLLTESRHLIPWYI